MIDRVLHPPTIPFHSIDSLRAILFPTSPPTSRNGMGSITWATPTEVERLTLNTNRASALRTTSFRLYSPDTKNMALNVELSAPLRQILKDRDCPGGVIGELRELQVVELADFAGLAARAQDLADFPHLPKLDDVTPEARLRTKMVIRRIWSECRDATSQLSHMQKGELRPGGRKPPLGSSGAGDSSDEEGWQNTKPCLRPTVQTSHLARFGR